MMRTSALWQKGCFYLLMFFFAAGMPERAAGQKLLLETCQFFGARPYVEVWLRIDRNAVDWKEAEGVFYAEVEVLLTAALADTAIVAADKFALKAAINDTLTDFLAVRRLALQPGNFTLTVETKDVNKPQSTIKVQQRLLVEAASPSTQLSEPLLLASVRKDTSNSALTKNGLAMEPLPGGVAIAGQQSLPVYIEKYTRQVSDTTALFIQCKVVEGFRHASQGKVLLTTYHKCKPQDEEAVLMQVPLQNLRSGSYHLELALINKAKSELARRSADFIRMNPAADIAWLESYNDEATNSFVEQLPAERMDYILKAHLPITEQHQVSTLGELLKSNRLASQRQFIFQLWKGKAPAAPEQAYQKYMEVVDAVDRKFHTNVGYGFQSDRGHLFLKYGKPTNVITVDTEVDAPPYEIWYYHSMPQTRQTNVRFLFYNPTLVHNNFQLLHSTCLGERINPAWEVELYKSVPQDRLGATIDATQVKEGTNRNARRYFNEY